MYSIGTSVGTSSQTWAPFQRGVSVRTLCVGDAYLGSDNAMVKTKKTTAKTSYPWFFMATVWWRLEVLTASSPRSKSGLSPSPYCFIIFGVGGGAKFGLPTPPTLPAPGQSVFVFGNHAMWRKGKRVGYCGLEVGSSVPAKHLTDSPFALLRMSKSRMSQ